MQTYIVKYNFTHMIYCKTQQTPFTKLFGTCFWVLRFIAPREGRVHCRKISGMSNGGCG